MAKDIEKFWQTDLGDLSGVKYIELRPLHFDDRVPSSEYLNYKTVAYTENGIVFKLKMFLRNFF